MPAQDEVYLKNLSEINFSINEMKVMFSELQKEVQDIDKTIERELVDGWKKVLGRKDLKVVYEADKELILVVNHIDKNTKANSDAIILLNESFVQKTENVISKISELLAMQKEKSKSPTLESKSNTPSSADVQAQADAVMGKKKPHDSSLVLSISFTAVALLSALAGYFLGSN